MRAWLKVVYAALAVITVVAHFVVSNLLMVLANQLGLLTFPLYFGSHMFLVGLVLLVLWPRHKEKIEAPAAFDKYLRVDEQRFSRGFWAWASQRGTLVLTLIAAVVLGPMFAALVLRFLKKSEHKAWLYSFLATIVATAIWVSFYLGAWDLIRSFFSSLVA